MGTLRITFYGPDRFGRLDETTPVAIIDREIGDPTDAAPIMIEIPRGAIWVSTQTLSGPKRWHDVPMMTVPDLAAPLPDGAQAVLSTAFGSNAAAAAAALAWAERVWAAPVLREQLDGLSEDLRGIAHRLHATAAALVGTDVE